MKWNFYLITLASLLTLVGCGRGGDPSNPAPLKNYQTDGQIENTLLDGQCERQLPALTKESGDPGMAFKKGQSYMLTETKMFVAMRISGQKAQVYMSSAASVPLCSAGGFSDSGETITGRSRQVVSEEVWSQFSISDDGVITIKSIADITAMLSQKMVNVSSRERVLDQPRTQFSVVKELVGNFQDGGEGRVRNTYEETSPGDIQVISLRWWRDRNSDNIRYTRVISKYKAID